MLRKLLLFALFFISTAHAQQTVSITDTFGWQAAIEEYKTGDRYIPFLYWDTLTPWVESEGALQYTRVYGRFTRPVKEAYMNSVKLPFSSDGRFDIKFGFPGTEKTFAISIVDPDGTTYRSTFHIRRLDQGPFSGPLFLKSLGAGFTRIQYNQPGLESFNEIALTLKGGITYRLVPEQFDLSFTSFLNALVLQSSVPGSKVQYLGLNFRLGYHLIQIPGTFRLVLNGGLYYNTSFGVIGFRNMTGPQIYPDMSFILANGRVITVYGKYSPAVAQGKIDLAINHEIATGVYYSFPWQTDSRLAIGLDYSTLHLSDGYATADTSTISLSTSLAF